MGGGVWKTTSFGCVFCESGPSGPHLLRQANPGPPFVREAQFSPTGTRGRLQAAVVQ